MMDKETEKKEYAAAVLYQCMGVLADDHPKRELLLDTLAWLKGSRTDAPDFEKLLPFRENEQRDVYAELSRVAGVRYHGDGR